jgi:hypothetical protein
METCPHGELIVVTDDTVVLVGDCPLCEAVLGGEYVEPLVPAA